jgi:RimJ/RimL family protein N-acetyltransferase
MIPLLETDRLILRPHRADDWDACAAIWGDPAVVRHIGGSVQDRQAVWFRVLRYAGMWSLLGYGMWAMEEKASGRLIGDAGFLSAARGVPELEGAPEAGWVLAPDAWGKGYAREAMAAALGWADAHLEAAAVRCIIEPGNANSVRVAEQLGFVAIADTRIGEEPIRVFERLRQAAMAGAASASP